MAYPAQGKSWKAQLHASSENNPQGIQASLQCAPLAKDIILNG